MRKLYVLMAVMLAALVLLSCGAQTQTSTASFEPSGSAAPDYLSWTRQDWEQASEAQQTDAARFVLYEIGDAFMPSFSELAGEAEADPDTQAQLEQSVGMLREKIGDFFAQADAGTSLREMVNAARQLIS